MTRYRRIIAIANHKGGVGKTTSVASIGAALANSGYNVLLVDLDAQANLTDSLLKDKSVESTIYEAMMDGELAPLPVVQIRENLSLVPSCLDMAAIEIELSKRQDREYILKTHIDSTEGEFDYILLDCPPSLGLITINSFTAADFVIVPLTAEALPFNGLTMIENILTMVKRNLNHYLKFVGVFLTRWEGRKLNKMVEGALRQTYKEKLLSTKIRTNIAIAEAPLVKEDIITYSKSSRGAKDYETLTEEIRNVISELEEAEDAEKYKE